MRVIADFHIHSRFSRACSKALTIPAIAAMCARKGIDLVATGDFTHPQWRAEIGAQLQETASGIFMLPSAARNATTFILGTELSCIAKQDGRVRRVHHLVLAPSLAAVDRITMALEARGCNLRSDGRPILGLTSRALLEICLEADPQTLLIPAHAWTPWFAIFGSASGYDTLAECFGDLAPYVTAIETGLSSDPLMNWRVSGLDRVALVSSSDAHSLPNLGREATVLEVSERTFDAVVRALRASAPIRYDPRAPDRIIETIEFFPEEGKYHVDGHRLCGVRCAPAETRRHRGRCPQCAKPLTIGVLHRVDNLADRSDGFTPPRAPSFRRTVPLEEVIAEAFGVASVTPRVRAAYDHLTRDVGSELMILLDIPLEVIARTTTPEVVEAIRCVRAGEVEITPGYDGVYGTVRVRTCERPRVRSEQRMLF